MMTDGPSPVGLDLVERLEPAHPGHADVHQHDRDIAFLEPLERLGPVLGEGRLDALFFEGFLEHPPDALVVVDYEYVFIGHKIKPAWRRSA